VTAEEKREIVFEELKRVVNGLKKEVEKEEIVIEKTLFFDEELLKLIEEMYLRGVVHAYNSIVVSNHFQNSRHQEKIICLQSYLMVMAAVVEEEKKY